MDESVINLIHDAATTCVLNITGGGASAISRLLAVPGASRTLLNARVPYAGAALDQLLGYPVANASSAVTARQLAMTAWHEALALGGDPAVTVGIGCTAALGTDRQRRGEDRCHIAVQTAQASRVVSVVFDKQRHDRLSEEQLCADLILTELAVCAGINGHGVTGEGITREEHQHTAPADWQALQLNTASATTIAEHAGVIFPGAFNPMHHGHVEMAGYAEQHLNIAVTLEISIRNVDKPPLDYLDMARRQEAIDHEYQLVFTNAPTFVEKAAIFPGAWFIVGADTISRIGEPRYYQNDPGLRDLAIKTLADHQVRFLVFGRHYQDRFITLDTLAVPDALRERCEGVAEDRFRQDISSSDIRERLGN